MKLLLILFTLLIYQPVYGQTVIQQSPVTVQAGVEYDFSFSVPPRARQTTLSWFRIRSDQWIPTSEDLIYQTKIKGTGRITHFKELPAGRYLRRVTIVQGVGRKTIVETKVNAVGKERETKSVMELNRRLMYK